MNQSLHKSRLVIATLGGIVVGSTSAAKEPEEIPFDEARLYFELNDTDGDLGIHSLIDGEPWKRLAIEGPDEREILQVWAAGRLRLQGLTEIFFESAEPPFESSDPDEVTLTPEQFFARFPEGVYEVSGFTLEGEELEAELEITHVMPAPPQIFVAGQPVSEDCESDPGPLVAAPFEISWLPVTESHPTIGRPGVAIELSRYEVIVERPGDPVVPLKMTVELPPDVTTLPFPAGLVSAENMKIEVLARSVGGNQTATESCFRVQ